MDNELIEPSDTDDLNQNTTKTNSKTKRLIYTDLVLMATLIIVIILDQLSKYTIKSQFNLYESWPEIGIFRIYHTYNTGTAFGLLQGQTILLIVASLIALIFLIYIYNEYTKGNIILRIALGLQLGGAISNLSDRLAFGAVTDFISVGWWPVFNIADSSIVVGITILISGILYREKISKVIEK
ncbi:MAG: signal peptidase II [SAR202 cluster bacterium]|nr:signal peptidase II [SAR202 cluster bacterium]|tara:strand:- start:16 stop:564 length:549 start_codon:yes stop_codon:yes gene_type:complete